MTAEVMTREQAEANLAEATRAYERATAALDQLLEANPQAMVDARKAGEDSKVIALGTAIADATKAVKRAQDIVGTAKDALEDAMDAERDEQRREHTAPIRDVLLKAIGKTGAMREALLKSVAATGAGATVVLDSESPPGPDEFEGLRDTISKAEMRLAEARLKYLMVETAHPHLAVLAELGWPKVQITCGRDVHGEPMVTIGRVKRATGERKRRARSGNGGNGGKAPQKWTHPDHPGEHTALEALRLAGATFASMTTGVGIAKDAARYLPQHGWTRVQ